ncbi:hypothetical protein Q7404_10415 [Glaesserella parasuis]|nr:hypothetical protein [Glaesserella parasuis]
MPDYKCPKCGGDLEDLSINDYLGWLVEEPYRCNGHYTGQFPHISKDCARTERSLVGISPKSRLVGKEVGRYGAKVGRYGA